jgi:hypothetical protein
MTRGVVRSMGSVVRARPMVRTAVGAPMRRVRSTSVRATRALLLGVILLARMLGLVLLAVESGPSVFGSADPVLSIGRLAPPSHDIRAAVGSFGTVSCADK